MSAHTETQYREVISGCRATFLAKARDYGASWKILRPASITDQIFIKARRIRQLETNGYSRVAEGVVPEYQGIINYCIMALMLLELPDAAQQPAERFLKADVAELAALYDSRVDYCYQTMLAKNHDYGEAWRSMRVTSFTDMILMKLLRIKQIEDHQGSTLVSEGVDAGYLDILNYAVFALIRLGEEGQA